MSEFKSGDKKLFKKSLDFYLNINPKDYELERLADFHFIENCKLNKSLIKKIMLKEKLKVGDTVYAAPCRWNKWQRGFEGIVSKVGRKYYTVLDCGRERLFDFEGNEKS